HIPTPRTRPGRIRDLDLVQDRLAYRTAPLGLLRRQTLVDLDLLSGTGEGPLTPGLATGEDVELSLRLAASGERIDYAVDLPPYVIGTGVAGGLRVPHEPAAEITEQVVERTTHIRRPVADELAAHARLVDLRWVRALPEA